MGGVVDQGVTGDNNNIAWALTDDGTLTLNGTGQMTDYGQTGVDAPWMKYNERITKVIMTGNITNVSRMAFNECSNLSEVVLPSTIKSIDNNAFYNCSSLKEFTFPAALETIGEEAFSGCRIENIELPDGLKTLGAAAFYFNHLSKLYIPKSVTSIGEFCFVYNDLESIEVEEGNTVYTSKDENGINCEAIIKKSTSDTDDVTLIQGCQNTVVGNNVTVIEEHAFYEQQYLSEIHIPNSVKKINRAAFQGCWNLRVLEIGEGLQYIGPGTFYYCPLESVTISAATPPTCGENAFGRPTDMTVNPTLYVPSYAVASKYRNNEAWSKFFPTIKTSEKRLYAELDQDNWALKFHYDDKTDFADGSNILEPLPVNFGSPDVRSLLNEYVSLNPSINDDARYHIKEIDFDPSFRNYKPTSCEGLFGNFRNVTKISHLEYLNTEDVENMYGMFAICRNLESLDLSSFNTSKVKNFHVMFNECQTLKNLDLTSFNTENATNMQSMFYCCYKMENLDLSSFNTSKVTNFKWMFYRVHGSEVNKCNIYVSDKFYIADEANGDEMFYKDLLGEKAEGKEYANYITGYFQKKVGTVGKSPIGAKGENLTVSQLTLTDGNDYVLTENAPVTATAATYSREMTSKWGTLCLPYTIPYDADSDYSFYGIEDINNDVVTLREITYDIEAGIPVLFCRKDNATNYTATITGSGKLIYSGRSINRLFGTFSSMVLDSKVLGYDQYFIAKDQFRRVGNDKVKLGAYRASLRPYLTTEAASTLRIAANGEATDINATEVLNGVNDGTAEYYNINGVRIDGLQKGMNIVKIGGKTRKVLVK